MLHILKKNLLMDSVTKIIFGLYNDNNEGD